MNVDIPVGLSGCPRLLKKPHGGSMREQRVRVSVPGVTRATAKPAYFSIVR